MVMPYVYVPSMFLYVASYTWVRSLRIPEFYQNNFVQMFVHAHPHVHLRVRVRVHVHMHALVFSHVLRCAWTRHTAACCTPRSRRHWSSGLAMASICAS